MLLKRILIPAITLTLCVSFFYYWTLGFNAFTVFSHTLEKAGPVPRVLPELRLTDQDGASFAISDRTHYILLNFVYLNCPYVCHKVTNQLVGVYHLLDSTLIPDQLELVTVSFDPRNDDRSKIARYRNFFGPEIDGWTFALPADTDEADFHKFLRETGIWVYREPATGLISHSTYIFLISPRNEIVRVFDPARENAKNIAEQLYSCVQKEEIASR